MLDVTTVEGWHWMLFKRFNDFVALDKEVSTKKKKRRILFYIFIYFIFSYKNTFQIFQVFQEDI